MIRHYRAIRRWSIVVLLCLGMVIAYVDRTALSVAITVPEFRNYFGLTDSQRGLMNSAFFWSYFNLFRLIPTGFPLLAFFAICFSLNNTT